ncbi:hypothetical protein VM1G_02541 [Cytospora mali]|uniref:HNH nuclease domain-containing protein n=1 Tax=Cytospora mali TaxID=578113 RepID=A0A194VR01_CYTMA|nr:hypothetical protein VM1G_02541 [Valsa mali]
MPNPLALDSASISAAVPSAEAPLRVQPGEDYTPPLRAALPQIDAFVAFRHPGYAAPLNMLFNLPRVERAGARDQWGVHYATALTACQIIANNSLDGYLAECADGQGRLDEASDPDTILLKSEYFFIVPSKPIYAVVPSFQEWRFPDILPRVWREAGAAFRPAFRGTGPGPRCAITGRFTVESAHLSPKEDYAWFSNNAMASYDSSSVGDINSASNRVYLDCSLHDAMDKRIWAFAPRHGRFVVQTIAFSRNLAYEHFCEFVHEYHGRNMTNSGRVEYIFARFAWAVLYLVKTFLLLPRQQTLLARFRIWEDGALQEKEEYLAPREINQLFGGGGSRSASSRKRNRTTSSQSAVDEGQRVDSKVDWGLEPNWNEGSHHDDQHDDGCDDDRHIGEWCEHVERADADPTGVEAQWDDQVFNEPRSPVRVRRKTREKDENEEDEVEQKEGRNSKRRRLDTGVALDSTPSLANTGTFSNESSSIASSPSSLLAIVEDSSRGKELDLAYGQKQQEFCSGSSPQIGLE